MAAPLGSLPRLTSSVLNRDVAQPLPLHRRSFIAPAAGLLLSGTTMQHRAVSQITSMSRQGGNIPPLSMTSTPAFTPASVPPIPATTQPLPAPVSTTVIITSALAPSISALIPPTTTTSPAAIYPTAVYTTVTQVLTTTPPFSPAFTAPQAIDTSSTLMSIVTSTTAGHIPSRSSSSSRPSASRSSASAHPSPAAGKPKSNVGKYVGYAIGAVFFLTLISSFFSAYRKHRKYVRKRPRGSIFIGAKLSDGQSTPQKRSMTQALMRSVSNRSFDAYALSNTPPTSPAPVFLGASQQPHPDLLRRARGISPSPLPVRPLPPTPSTTKYSIHEDDAVFYPHVPAVDPHEYSPRYSPFGVSSSGNSTQTSASTLAPGR